jgi:uncharacterized protein
VIDVDLHQHIPDWNVVASFAPAGLRWRIARRTGPRLATTGLKMIGAGFGDVPLPTMPNGRPGHPAADPAWVGEHYLEPRGIDRAILTGPALNLGVQPNPDLAAAIARAVNDWTLETWVRPFPRYKASLLVAQQDPAQAVAEIDRLGDDPGMVQVLLCSAGEAPLGRRMYHPIYAACVEHGLPLALHIGGEGAGASSPSTAVGHPSTYFEWYADLSQVYMAHITSMVTEGVFERFPTLKVVLYEGGIAWLPHLMWRFDKNWKAQRTETPWLQNPPSAAILDHFFSTTYPLEAVPNPTYLQQILEMMDGQRTLLYAGNYPNWQYGDPATMLAGIPGELHRRILVDNALAVYGERLLASNEEKQR